MRDIVRSSGIGLQRIARRALKPLLTSLARGRAGEKMTLVFQSLIDRLAGAKDGSDLTAAVTRFAGTLGLTKFTYLGFYRPRPVYLTTYPTEWVYRYASKRYHEIDPVVVQARGSMLPFFWDGLSPSVDTSREQRTMFGEASEVGIHCGLTVPIHDSQGELATLSFASDGKPEEMRAEVDAHRDVLHLASIYLHVYAREKLADATAFEHPRLSPREVACLQWVIRGKSTWDIGEILSISRRTVVFHLENAKRKLRAVTLPQAVATALYHKLIEY
jgi:LuxR family transcriptional activator of conjugal transfer of Ti plasmids